MTAAHVPNILKIDYSSRSPAAFDSESNTVYSYAQLGAEVRRIAGAIESPAKALTFCFCRNDYQMLRAYLGASAAGHAVTLLDPDSPRQASLVDAYQPDYILRSTQSPAETYPNYELIDSGGPLIWRHPRTSQQNVYSDLALLLTTSGSTGTPKFVRLSSANVFANASSITRELKIDSRDCAITSLPFHYSYGLSVIHTHLYAGAMLALTSESLTSRRFWNVFREARCTSFAGVPYSYHLLRRLGLPREGLSSLTTMTQAGGHLPSDLAIHYSRAMNARKGRFYVMYGQTEATARISILPPECLPEKCGCVGKAICGGELRAGPTPTRADGEIVYRGPNVMLGYAQTRADLSLGDDLNGVLHTGDAGSLDRDGFLFITGRLNRFAKVSGNRVNLDEVESILRPYGPAAAIASGDKLVIFCESSQQDSLVRRRDALARDLSLHRQFLELRTVPSLPLKPNGKIDYRFLEEAVAQC